MNTYIHKTTGAKLVEQADGDYIATKDNGKFHAALAADLVDYFLSADPNWQLQPTESGEDGIRERAQQAYDQWINTSEDSRGSAELLVDFHRSELQRSPVQWPSDEETSTENVMQCGANPNKNYIKGHMDGWDKCAKWLRSKVVTGPQVQKLIAYKTLWTAKDSEKEYPHGWGFDPPVVLFGSGISPTDAVDLVKMLSNDEFTCYDAVPIKTLTAEEVVDITANEIGRNKDLADSILRSAGIDPVEEGKYGKQFVDGLIAKSGPQEIKVGTILYAINPCTGVEGAKKKTAHLTVGKGYEVQSVDETDLLVTNDLDELHYFSLNQGADGYSWKTFFSLNSPNQGPQVSTGNKLYEAVPVNVDELEDGRPYGFLNPSGNHFGFIVGKDKWTIDYIQKTFSHVLVPVQVAAWPSKSEFKSLMEQTYPGSYRDKPLWLLGVIDAYDLIRSNFLREVPAGTVQGNGGWTDEVVKLFRAIKQDFYLWVTSQYDDDTFEMLTRKSLIAIENHLPNALQVDSGVKADNLNK